MLSVQCSKSFIRFLFAPKRKSNDLLVAYRYYLIAKIHFCDRSGIFSVQEFMDVLNTYYDYASLHHKPGNNRSKFAQKLITIFDSYKLFEKLLDGRYKIVPEKKIIGKSKVRNSTKITLCSDDLKKQSTFIDRLIGMVSCGSFLKSYQSIADQTGFTRRRCISAAKRNHEQNKFLKVFNYILVKSSKLITDINNERASLLAHHNIQTPKPIRYGREWYLALFAPNTYVNLSIGAKHTNQSLWGETSIDCSSLTPYISNKRCYYSVLSPKSILYRRNPNTCFLMFNENNFTYQDYINNYSHLVGEVRSVA